MGPINKRVYGSFAPKRHAFAWAAREAAKRGFDPKSEHSLIQFVSDGDPDLRDLADEYFPRAMQTIDLYHVMEYVWSAGECLHTVGSGDLSGWVAQQKKRLLRGQHRRVTREIEDTIAKAGDWNAKQLEARERLMDAFASDEFTEILDEHAMRRP